MDISNSNVESEVSKHQHSGIQKSIEMWTFQKRNMELEVLENEHAQRDEDVRTCEETNKAEILRDMAN